MTLHIDAHLLPAMRSIVAKEKKWDRTKTLGDDPAGFMQWMGYSFVEGSLTDYENALKFDCRKIPEDFIVDTGIECINEIDAGGECPRLPFHNCLFEFNNAIIRAHILSDGDKEELGSMEMVFETIRLPINDQSIDIGLHSRGIWTRKEFAAHYDSDVPFSVIEQSFNDPEAFPEDDEAKADLNGRYGGPLLVGLLALLEERLLRQESRKGDGLVKNARAKQKGQTTSSSYRILTLNLAEAKRRTKGVVLHHHESPRLHWRRGHWRTLHRLSEFESRIWIKRMLVGDPSKGFVQKHYRAVWNEVIH